MPLKTRTNENLEPAAKPRRTLAGAAGSVSAAILISRLLGVARETVIARYFGAGLATDAYNIAYRIPNLLRDLFAEGALSSAFVPTFIRCLRLEGKDSAWELANKVLNALLVVLGGMTLVFYFGARGFVYLLASGYAENPEKFELTVQMTRIMSPFLLWVALAAVVMGMLNASGSFFVPASASSAFNICSILAGIFLSPLMPGWGYPPIIAMAVGALVGGISQFAVQLPYAYRLGFRYRFVVDFRDPALRHMARLMLPAIIGLSATQINITVDNQLASQYGNGPVSWLNYAFRLMHLPIGVFGIALATVTLTTVSQHAADNAMDKLGKALGSSLRLAACLTFPSTVGLILYRKEIVRVLYQYGSFLPSDTLETSRVLAFYALSLFAYSAVKILVPTFYALNDTRTPVRMSVITVAVKILTNFALVWPLRYLGLALATSVASWVNLFLLLRRLGGKMNSTWGWRDLAPYARIALASLAMGAVSQAAFYGAATFFPGDSAVRVALHLGAAISAAVLSLVPLLQAFRVEEASELAAIIRRKLLRRRA
jgi:putative peptidoglycan lipid II flippase